MTDVDLLPCPFCGEVPRLWLDGWVNGRPDSPAHYVIECDTVTCGLGEWIEVESNVAEMVSAWNTRSDTIPAMLAAARAEGAKGAARIADGYGACAVDVEMRDEILALIDTPAPDPVQEAVTVLPSGKWCECGLPHETGGPCWECRALSGDAP